MQNRKNKMILFCVFILFVVFISIFFMINLDAIKNQEHFITKQKEQFPEFSYTIYSNENEKIQAIVKIQNEIGIKEIKYPNNETIIECFGKTSVAIDYVVEKNKKYVFTVIDTHGEEKQHVLELSNLDEFLKIDVKAEKEKTTEVKVIITYGANGTNEYLLGNNSNWQVYTDEIMLDSYTVINKQMANSDGVVNVKARIVDDVGNKIQVEKNITCLDIDIPQEPVINQISVDPYTYISQYGINLNSTVSVTYDTRNDITNYYSIDNGNTWEKYIGEFETNRVKIIAKSVKNETGLERKVQKSLSPSASNVIKGTAYDGDENTYFEVYGECYGPSEKYYINIDSNMIGKNVVIKASNQGGSYVKYTTVHIEFINDSQTVLGTKTIVGNMSKQEIILSIPSGSTKMRVYVDAAGVGNTGITYTRFRIYEIQTCDEPIINNVKYYPNLTNSVVKDGFNIINISYFPTSVKRLYKIDDGDWKEYEDSDIKLNIGQTIYAKGIDKYGTETRKVSQYKAVLPSNAIAKVAHDENENTYFEIYGECYSPSEKYYINIDNNMIGKNVVLKASNQGGSYVKYTTVHIEFVNDSQTVLGNKTIVGNMSKQEIVLNIPSGSTKMRVYVDAARVGNTGITYTKFRIHEIYFK